MLEAIKIIYSIETNPDSYVTEEEHEVYVPALVDRIEREVQAMAETCYPSLELETRRVPERSSHNNRSYFVISGLDGEENEGRYFQAERVAQDLLVSFNEYVEANWIDWFDQVADIRPAG